MMRLSAFVSALLFVFSVSAATGELRLVGVPITPFLIEGSDGYLSGPSIEIMDCVLGDLNISYKVCTQPIARAELSMREHKFDGIFLFAKSNKRDQYGEATQPFWRHHRTIYTNQPVSEPVEKNLKDKRVGVLMGSASERWLIAHGFTNIHHESNFMRLFKLLKLGRIDALISTDSIVDHLLVQDASLKPVYNYAIGFMDVVAYFSHDYLADHPGFMRQFNQRLPQCANAVLASGSGTGTVKPKPCQPENSKSVKTTGK